MAIDFQPAKIAVVLLGVYCFGMGTLIEIETAVDRLPFAEQEKLLRHLEMNLRRRRGSSESREAWMRRLEALRNSMVLGTSVEASGHLLQDLRED